MTVSDLDHHAPKRHMPIRRSLAILKRLRSGAASKSELISFVNYMVGETYIGTDKMQSRTFEADILRLRELGARIEYAAGNYRLTDSGDLLA